MRRFIIQQKVIEMIIHSLKLKDFKSYKDSEFKFDTGISLILGENGAGKSTILEAISYALFKEVSNRSVNDIIRRPVDDDDIVKEMKVIVEFTHNHHRYTVERTKKKSKADAVLKEYNESEDKYKLLCNGDKNVTREINSLLEIDSSNFLNAVYVRQGEITELIDKTPAERKKVITKLLNLESLQKVQEKMKEIIRVYEDIQTENSGKIAEYDHKTKQLEILEQGIKDLESQIIENKKEEETLKGQLEEITKDKDNMQKNKEEYEKISTKIDERKKRLDDLQKSKIQKDEEIKSLEAEKQNIAKLEEKIQILPKLREVKEFQTKIEQVNKDLKIVNKTISDITDAQKQLVNTEDDHKRYEEIEKEVQEVNNNIESLTAEANRIAELKNNIKNKKENKDEFFQKVNKIAKQVYAFYHETFENIEQIENFINKTKNDNQEALNKARDALTEIDKKISMVDTNLNEREKSLRDLMNTKDKCPICQSNISHQRHQQLEDGYKKDIESFKKQLEQLNTSKDRQANEIKTLEEDEKKVNSINLEKLHEDYSEFERLTKEVKTLEEELPDDADDTKKRLDDQKKLKEDIESESKKLRASYDTYNLSVITLEKLPELEEVKENQETYLEKVTELKSNIEKIQQSNVPIDNLDKRLRKLEKDKSDYDTLVGKVAQLDTRRQEQKELSTQIDETATQLEDLDKKIGDINYDEKSFEKIKEDLEKQQNSYDGIKTKLVENETKLTNSKENHENTIKEIKELDEIKKEQENIKDYIKLLGRIRDVYDKDGVQKDLRNAVRPQIERSTLEIFNEFGFNYSSLKLDEDYNMTINRLGEELTLDLLSGGEKIVIALALRLGIAKVISQNKTELLILDEPTIHLDAERRSDLIEIIRNINFVPQMIVVTHDEEMESLSNNIIKVSKNDGISYCED